jgi:hypothetical protein
MGAKSVRVEADAAVELLAKWQCDYDDNDLPRHSVNIGWLGDSVTIPCESHEAAETLASRLQRGFSKFFRRQGHNIVMAMLREFGERLDSEGDEG